MFAFSRPVLPVLALSAAFAGCSSWQAEPPRPDPNLFPANYKSELVLYLIANPRGFENTRESYLSAPVLKPFGNDSRYVACLRVIGPDWRREKMVVYFGGEINQFVDATKEMCATAAYQPFPEATAELSKFGMKR